MSLLEAFWVGLGFPFVLEPGAWGGWAGISHHSMGTETAYHGDSGHFLVKCARCLSTKTYQISQARGQMSLKTLRKSRACKWAEK